MNKDDITPNSLLQDIKKFKPFSYLDAQQLYATELAKSIIHLLQKLEIKPCQILVYDSRMARLRELKYSHIGVETFYWGCLMKFMTNFRNGMNLRTLMWMENATIS